MDINEIHRLIELMNENELLELELVEDSKKIRLKKKYDGGPRVIAAPMAAAPAHAPVAAAAAPQGAAPSGPPAGTIEIKSPMVGTFYRSSNPESPPYVEEGDAVTASTTVCIVEAMKVFNEIKAEVEGTVVAILVENGQTVEYGQPMFLVKPS
ncbi:MAG: acetyl-CoA carboxylase biotin carboxyl carrier protein [Planctomycetes bacterium]|nr:acetyl-CoA carboxylase biotin carboxyl carrier protein [Planctomycetota bacterium]MCB9934735.1 acetyl-CoA carboxylase biotin carboxyl carrier protein [Planctomycetota bacterium]